MITYSDKKIISATGQFTLKTETPLISPYNLFADGRERVEEIPAGGNTILYQIPKGTEHTFGCHADVSAGAEIKLFVHDGSETMIRPN